MSRKTIFKQPFGLRRHFVYSAIISVVLCAAVFCVLYFSSQVALTAFFEQSDLKQMQIKRVGRNLQNYVEYNNISSTSLALLKKWEERWPVILLEIYADDTCIYSSFYDSPDFGHSYEESVDGRDNEIIVQLTDRSVVAILYCDFTYKYFMGSIVFSIIVSFVLLILFLLRSNRKLIHYICRLNDEVQIIEGGDLDYQVSVEGNDEITELAKSMNRMREAFRDQRETEQRLFQSNRQLITEMSHDLRTPLTSILLYLEILRSHNYLTDEQAQDYLEKINTKTYHLKQLTDHLFVYLLKDINLSVERETNVNDTVFTKVPSEQVDFLIPLEIKTMEQAFSPAITELIDDIKANNFSVESDLTWNTCSVKTNPECVHRIFENIFSNIKKYADPTLDIYINTIYDSEYCGFIFMNSCKEPSDSIESSHIGIENIRKLMLQQNGQCFVEHNGMAYEITLLFPLA